MSYVEIIKTVFWAITTLLSFMTLHYIFFTIVGLFTHKKYPKANVQKKYGVIIPARNEENVVANLIESIQKNNYPQDKLHIFVIAHNCTDRTAEVARNVGGGVTVYEYNNPNECTMGYAFRHLFECIKRDFGIENYDGFFLFNADNILDKNYFEKMNDAFVACGCKDVITSFRNSKNFGTNIISGMYGIHFMAGCRLESRGRTVLGCSTRVQGTGYVISSDIVKDGWKYVTLTEDWEFSADQILQGNKIKFCDEAVFYDEQPVSTKIMIRQRLRWAKGHLLVFKEKSWQLFKNLFNPKGKNKGSTFDILTNIFPLVIVSFFLSILEVVLLAFGPLMGIDIVPTLLELLKNAGIGLAGTYIVMFIQAILIFIVERKRIRGVPFYKKVLMTFFWPIFTIVNLPISLVALFRKIGWKAIPHVDETNHEKLNDEDEDKNDVIEEEDDEEIVLQPDTVLDLEANETNNK